MTKYILAVIVLAVVVLGVTPAAASVMEDETEVQATVQLCAIVKLSGDLILHEEAHANYDLYGEIDLTFGANYGHQLKVHWLDTDYWNHDSAFMLVGGGPWYSWGGLWQGKLGLMVDTDNPAEAGDLGNESGAVTYDNASVIYDGEHKGTIQVTLHAW